jgi:hypothetical protein
MIAWVLLIPTTLTVVLALRPEHNNASVSANPRARDPENPGQIVFFRVDPAGVQTRSRQTSVLGITFSITAAYVGQYTKYYLIHTRDFLLGTNILELDA